MHLLVLPLKQLYLVLGVSLIIELLVQDHHSSLESLVLGLVTQQARVSHSRLVQGGLLLVWAFGALVGLIGPLGRLLGQAVVGARRLLWLHVVEVNC